MTSKQVASRTFYWLVLAAAVGLLGWNVYYRAIESRKQRSDFVMFHAAGRAALEGGDVYAVEHPSGWPYYYPPTMTVLTMAPALLPLPWAVLAWYALSVAALLWAGRRLIALLAPIAGPRAGPIVVLAFIANFGPVVGGLQRGQISAILLCLMVEALWCLRGGRNVRGGSWIALAAALKAYPALLVLPLIVRRQWRALAGFAVALAIFLVVVPPSVRGPARGWADVHEWTSRIVVPFVSDRAFAQGEVMSGFNQYSPSNQSLFGVLARWLARGSLADHEPFALSVADLRPGTVRLLAAAAAMVLLMWMAIAARGGAAPGTAAWLVAFTLPMVLANAISHIAWHHYYTVLVVPYALAWALALDQSASAPSHPGLVLALTAAVLLNWVHYAVHPFARQCGLLLLGSLSLLVVLTWTTKGRWRLAQRPSPAGPRP